MSNRQFDTRIVSLAIGPKDAEVYDERVTVVRIETEGGGEYIKICHGEHEIGIDPDEWPYVRDAVNRMIKECR